MQNVNYREFHSLFDDPIEGEQEVTEDGAALVGVQETAE